MSGPVQSVVLGACGFVGSHLCEVLVQAGHEVRAFDEARHVADGLETSFPEVLRGLGLTPRGWSLDWREPLDGASFLFVASGPQTQLEAALASADPQALRRVVLVSGAEVYGPSRGEPFAEEAAPAPGDAHAEELLELERVVRESGLPHVVLRPAGLYGPRGARGLREARQRIGLGRLDPEPLGLVHVRDVARAALHVAVRPELAQATTYNLGDRRGLSAGDACRLVSRLAGRPHVSLPLPRWLRAPQRAGRALAAGAPAVQSARLTRTGFVLDYPDPAAGLRETVAWYKQEGWL